MSGSKHEEACRDAGGGDGGGGGEVKSHYADGDVRLCQLGSQLDGLQWNT